MWLYTRCSIRTKESTVISVCERGGSKEGVLGEMMLMLGLRKDDAHVGVRVYLPDQLGEGLLDIGTILCKGAAQPNTF